MLRFPRGINRESIDSRREFIDSRARASEFCIVHNREDLRRWEELAER